MPFELREMDFGTIIDRGLKLFKDNFVPLVLIMAIFYGPFLFVMEYSVEITLNSARESNTVLEIGRKMLQGQPPDLNDLDALSQELPLSKLKINMGLSALLILLAPLSYLSIFHILSEHIQGRSPTIGKALGFAARRYWILLGAFILVQLLLSAINFAASCCILTQLHYLTLAFLGLLGCIEIPIIIMMVLFVILFIALLPCVVTMENFGARKTISRTWGLLRGFWWRSLGIYFLAFLLVSTLVFIFMLVGRGIGGFMPPDISAVFTASISTLFSVILQPVMWAVLFLIYIDIRIRKEHLDLEILANRTYNAGKPPTDKPPVKDDKDDVWS